MAFDFFAAQVGTYSAETTRRAMFSWAARTGANSPGIIASGLVSATDLQVSAPASGMSCLVGAGEAVIGGNEGGSQGGYYFRNSALISAVVAAANASLPRIDAVVITMADAGYAQPTDVGGTANGGVLAVITGSPTSGATLSNLTGAPTIPGSSLLLAYILVPASATNIIAADIANKATQVHLGVAGIGVPARAHLSATTTFGSGTGTYKVPMDTLDYDPGGHFDVTTNHRYNCANTGYYLVAVSAAFAQSSGEFQGMIYKNGIQVSIGADLAGFTGFAAGYTEMVACSAGDYLELFVFCQNGANNSGLAGRSFMAVTQIG